MSSTWQSFEAKVPVMLWEDGPEGEIVLNTGLQANGSCHGDTLANCQGTFLWRSFQCEAIITPNLISLKHVLHTTSYMSLACVIWLFPSHKLLPGWNTKYSESYVLAVQYYIQFLNTLFHFHRDICIFIKLFSRE